MIKQSHFRPLLFFFICLVNWVSGNSQVNRPVYWIKHYGGSNAELPIQIRATPDGGNIFCGSTLSNDFDINGGLHGTEKDIWLVKVDKNGVIQWQKTYLTNGTEDPKNLIVTSDGGYALCGSINVGAVSHTLVLKLSSDGTIQWQKQWVSTKAFASSITETADGGFALTGLINSNFDGEFAGQPGHGLPVDLFVARLNNAGTFLWGKTYGGSQGDLGKFIIELSDGNLLVGADSYSNDGDVSGNHHAPFSNSDYWIMKLTPDGNFIWKKCYGGNGGEFVSDGFVNNNRYYLIGTTGNSSATPSGDVTGLFDGNEIWYVVLDTAGTLIRQKCIGGTGNSDVAYSIAPTVDGKLIIGGNSNSNNHYVSGNLGQSDYALIKIDTVGNKVWGKLFGNSSDQFGGVQFGARAAVNADSSFTLLAGSLIGGGEIPASYGNNDLLLIRYIDTSLYQDLYSKLIFNANAFEGRPIPYKLVFGRNNDVVTEDTVILKLLADSNLQLVSINRPPSLVDGDTLIWKMHKTAVLRADTISMIFQLDPGLAPLPDSVRMRSFIGPYATEYFQTNNVFYAASKVKNQNAGIINPTIDITSSASISANKPVIYFVPYSFQNQLDTLNGFVRLIKDPKIQILTTVPPYDLVSGDTLTWNFSVATGTINRNILVTMQADTPYVQLGDSIRTFVQLQFNTQDTGVLKRFDSLKQVVNQICTIPGTVNNTLSFPQGLQWLRLSGGSADDLSVDIAALTDTTFLAISRSFSHDGDLAAAPPYRNSFVTKYRTDGTMIWQQILGGNGDDELHSLVITENGSAIVAGETTSSTGPFATNHGLADVWLTKLDSNGNILWQKTLGGSQWDGNNVFIKKFRENRYIVAAGSNSTNGDVASSIPTTLFPPWVFMIDGNGTILSQKVYRDTLFTTFSDMQVTLDKRILLAGGKAVFNPVAYESARLVKVDTLGNIISVKNYRNAGRDQRIISVSPLADTSTMLAGISWTSTVNDPYCYGDHLGKDIWVAKTDQASTLQWEKYFGGDLDDFPTQILKSTGEGFLIPGYTFSNNGNVTGNHDVSGNTSDAWLVKMHDNGEIAWQKTIGGNNNDAATRVLQVSNSEIIVAGSASSYNNGDIFGSKGEADALIFKIGASNSITGMVYLDYNGNHVRESNEPLLDVGLVKSTKGILTNSSDIDDGYFATAVDTGTYVSEPLVNSTYIQSYPVTDTSSFTSYGNVDSVNFAMVPVGIINDLKITVLPVTPARPGFGSDYIIKYENIGTTTITSGNVTLIKDPRSSYVSSTLPYTSMIADTIKWNFSNFGPFETNEFVLTLDLAPPPILEIGDTLHFVGIINPIVGDSTIINNVSTVNQLVTGSFDPNDKTETHGPGFPSQLLGTGEALNYVIRFQNTGTDTAFRVIIRDTLDHKLDWSTLQMISASHDYQFVVTNGNLLEWKFNPIVLPDSTHNEPASHGFVAFSIEPEANLLPGDTIANRAAIYFDFNQPVLTNTQHTIIDNGLNDCPGANRTYSSGIPGAIAYKWQVNDGTGYVDLQNNSIYSGVHSDTLRIINPPTSLTGNKYRCIVTTAGGNVTSIEYQLKFSVTWMGTVSTAWEEPDNWECGVLPDAYTDVIIKSGTVIVSSSTEIRSLTLKAGVQFQLNAGVVFSVLH